MRLASLLWWGAEVRDDARELHEKRDQVLAFLENELDNPATANRVEEVLGPSSMLPEVMAACARLNISLLPDTDDCEGGYAFIDESMRAPRAWDVLSKLKTAYLNCVNGVAFQNEQIGILVADLRARRGELAVLKAKRELHSLVSSLESPSSCTTTLASDESEVAISNSLVCIAHAKLDLEDRLNKRRQQQKRKDEIADVILRKLCAALQLAAFSPQMMTGCSSVRAPASADCPAHRDRGKKDFDEQAAGAHDATRASRRLDNSTKVRRRHGARAEVSYSDAEIKSLLKSLD